MVLPLFLGLQEGIPYQAVSNGLIVSLKRQPTPNANQQAPSTPRTSDGTRQARESPEATAVVCGESCEVALSYQGPGTVGSVRKTRGSGSGSDK